MGAARSWGGGEGGGTYDRASRNRYKGATGGCVAGLGCGKCRIRGWQPSLSGLTLDGLLGHLRRLHFLAERLTAEGTTRQD